jgi:methylmalonyl-CoA mutase
MRSLATRESDKALSKYVQDAIDICKEAGYDFIILESAGVGQSDASILDYCKVSMYVMTPEYGAATQLEKIDMLDFADIIAVNKFDKKGAADALRDVKKQFQRNHKLFDQDTELMPVFGTIAAQFNDPGMNTLYRSLLNVLDAKTGSNFNTNFKASDEMSEKVFIIPPSRNRYLSEISETIRSYNQWADEQSDLAQKLYQLEGTKAIIQNNSKEA